MNICFKVPWKSVYYVSVFRFFPTLTSLCVAQVWWRWCRLCCSWETCLSRRSVTLIRPPCRMTPVRIFTHLPNHKTLWKSSPFIYLSDLCVSPSAAQKVCHLLSINVTDFTRAILSPRIKVCNPSMKVWHVSESHFILVSISGVSRAVEVIMCCFSG